jgi:hypothetical protein
MGLHHSIRGKARGFGGMYIRHALESISANMVEKGYHISVAFNEHRTIDSFLANSLGTVVLIRTSHFSFFTYAFVLTGLRSFLR